MDVSFDILYIDRLCHFAHAHECDSLPCTSWCTRWCSLWRTARGEPATPPRAGATPTTSSLTPTLRCLSQQLSSVSVIFQVGLEHLGMVMGKGGDVINFPALYFLLTECNLLQRTNDTHDRNLLTLIVNR